MQYLWKQRWRHNTLVSCLGRWASFEMRSTVLQYSVNNLQRHYPRMKKSLGVCLGLDACVSDRCVHSTVSVQRYLCKMLPKCKILAHSAQICHFSPTQESKFMDGGRSKGQKIGFKTHLGTKPMYSLKLWTLTLHYYSETPN